MERLKRRQFTAEFKLEAARYVLDQGMSFAEVGKRLGVLPKLVVAVIDGYALPDWSENGASWSLIG